VAKDCAYANCLDVEDDWFNILFTKCESIVNAYFTEVSISAISLRTDGIVRSISSWDQLQHKFTLSANQLMEIKLATYNFKRDENRSPGTLHIAQCYATISREIPSSKPIAQFALWLSVTRYADKWARYAIHNFPNWSPAVDHDGRYVLEFTNKVFTNMVPKENDANYIHYPTFFGAYDP
jgi:hypothetical protein